MQNPLGRNQRDWRLIGTASGLGCSVVASLLLCVVGGVLLDRWIGTGPVLTLVGILLGIVAAGYLLYELAVLSQPDKGLIRRRRSGENGRRKPDEGR